MLWVLYATREGLLRERAARERAQRERYEHERRVRLAAEQRRRAAQPTGPRYYRAGAYDVTRSGNGYIVHRRGDATFSDVFR
jgi:hypothetical protein